MLFFNKKQAYSKPQTYQADTDILNTIAEFGEVSVTANIGATCQELMSRTQGAWRNHYLKMMDKLKHEAIPNPMPPIEKSRELYLHHIKKIVMGTPLFIVRDEAVIKDTQHSFRSTFKTGIFTKYLSSLNLNSSRTHSHQSIPEEVTVFLDRKVALEFTKKQSTSAITAADSDIVLREISDNHITKLDSPKYKTEMTYNLFPLFSGKENSAHTRKGLGKLSQLIINKGICTRVPRETVDIKKVEAIGSKLKI